ncbi:hypothetical protein AB4Y36_10200 [Paraburkholderia sp. BR10936]|uniref:hypothetical protein n=1 Tax=Paraburkholderia sp. BR10936 TaxID=3236993 RepID=UPI0034D21F16
MADDVARIRKEEAKALESTKAIEAGGVTVQLYAKREGISESAARYRLEKLVKAGKASKQVFKEPELRTKRGGSGFGYEWRRLAVYTISGGSE